MTIPHQGTARELDGFRWRAQEGRFNDWHSVTPWADDGVDSADGVRGTSIMAAHRQPFHNPLL